ncbi:MAG: hypothetical protein C3F11_04325 [Methylocystaceae bacterium]|nr:MAG: hypothetical protein C3F11_04325 [Methylocystaceae bacterium]
MFRRVVRMIAALSCAFLVVLAVPAAGASREEPLEIVTATGPHVLRVEMARTSKEREKGLMFRTSLAPDAGMLFDFHSEQTILMWMKNTPLSLDMIFVSSAGRVVSVAQETAPFSERVISSGAPASAVIEVNAGTARRLSVAVGDVVRHPIFGK